jgi:putative Holliday junction resolvase
MRALGVDFGRRRIGLALSDATGMLARPWKTIGARASIDAVAADLVNEIEHLRHEGEPVEVVVVGLPRRLSGEPNEQTPLVQALVARLAARAAGLPIVLQDERLSSRAAECLVARRVKDWRKRKPLIDATAAAVILQDYLDSRTPPLPSAQEQDC